MIYEVDDDDDDDDDDDGDDDDRKIQLFLIKHFRLIQGYSTKHTIRTNSVSILMLYDFIWFDMYCIDLFASPVQSPRKTESSTLSQWKF